MSTNDNKGNDNGGSSTYLSCEALSNDIDYYELITPEIVNNSSDHYFKGAIKDRDILIPLLNDALKEGIFPHLDLGTIRIVDTALINRSNLAEFRTDALFAIKYIEEERTDVLFLFEHKSYPKRDYEHQAIKYKILIWEDEEARSPRNEPYERTPIISIIISHGRGKVKIKRFKDSYKKNIGSNLESALLDYKRFYINFQDRKGIEFNYNFKSILFATLLINSDEPLNVMMEKFSNVLKNYSTEELKANYDFIVFSATYVRGLYKNVADEEIFKHIKLIILG